MAAPKPQQVVVTKYQNFKDVILQIGDKKFEIVEVKRKKKNTLKQFFQKGMKVTNQYLLDINYTLQIKLMVKYQLNF